MGRFIKLGRLFRSKEKKRRYRKKSSAAMEQLKESVSDEQFADLKQAFATFDWDNDGFIDAEDFRRVMKKLGHDLAPKEAKKLFKDICKQPNGKMDFADFVEMMAQEDTPLKSNEGDIKTAFNFLDQNGNGYITLEELKARFPGCLTDDNAQRLIQEADKDGDGKINYEEFKEVMTHEELGVRLVQSEIELYS